MGLSELFEKRRSIRAYKENTVITKEQVEEIIKAAQEAPTWKNSQAGRYYVAITPEKLEEVKGALPPFNQKNATNAPVLIVTTFVKGLSGCGQGPFDFVNEPKDEWGAYDLGLQNENLILKASEMGMDTLIMGIRDGEMLRGILGIPEEEEVMAVISLGYRDKEPKKPARKDISEIAKFF